MATRIGLVLLTITLGGCATLFGQSVDVISIKSEPSGANVYVNGQKVGQTPLEHRFDRSVFRKTTVKLKKAGYKTQEVPMKKTLNGLAVLNLSFITSWSTDAASGNVVQYHPDHYLMELEKEGETAFRPNRQAYYLAAYREPILRDMASGEGEYLKNAAALLDTRTEALLEKVAPHFDRLARTEDGVAFYRALNEILGKEAS